MSHYLQEQASASGHHGQAWASGDYGQASATGKYGLAVAQRRVAAGESGAIVARCWDEEEQEYRDIVGHIGLNGIKRYHWYAYDAINGWRKEEPVADALLMPEQVESRVRA